MNSFIKKIAFVMSGVLVGSFMVAAPAQAAAMTLSVPGAVSGSGTAVSPYTLTVPYDNTVNTTSGSAPEALTVTAGSLSAGDTVTFTTTNAKIVSATGTNVTTADGVTTLTVTTASTSAVVYVYSTTTAAGRVTATSGGTTVAIYTKASAGTAYNVSLSLPSSGNQGTTVKANAFVKDVFGNPTTGTVSLTAVNATVPLTATLVSAALGKYEFSLTFPSTAGTVAVQASISATDVPGLAEAIIVASGFITVADKDATIASLTAELAKVKADLEAEKTARAADKVVADKSLSDAKADADRAALDAANALAAATAQTLELAKIINKLRAKYNKMAKKYGFKRIS